MSGDPSQFVLEQNEDASKQGGAIGKLQKADGSHSSHASEERRRSPTAPRQGLVVEDMDVPVKGAIGAAIGAIG